jgi:hypothetical protein
MIGGKRFWSREDILAYKDGRPLRARLENELGGLYIGTGEIAAKAGIRPSAVRNMAMNPRQWIPAPQLVLGSVAIYDRAEVEAALARREAARVGRPNEGNGS